MSVATGTLTDLMMQSLNIFFHRINELGLIFLNCTTNLMVWSASPRYQSLAGTHLWSHEQRIELREHSEHLVRVPGRSKSVAQSGDDLVLHPGDMFVVGVLRRHPDLIAL